jgi:hypothetical protein
MPRFTPTGWRFTTSEGIDSMVSVAGLAIAGQAGRLYVQDPRRRQHRFRYVCGGSGFGVGLRAGDSALETFLRTASVDFFSTDMTSGNIGTIWKGPGAGRELTARDFVGDCIMVGAQGGAVGGGSVTLILCAAPGTLKLVGLSAVGSALTGAASVPSLLMTGIVLSNILNWSKCVGLMYGTNVGAQLGASVLGLHGRLTW